jgi:hypothetical protein
MSTRPRSKRIRLIYRVPRPRRSGSQREHLSRTRRMTETNNAVLFTSAVTRGEIFFGKLDLDQKTMFAKLMRRTNVTEVSADPRVMDRAPAIRETHAWRRAIAKERTRSVDQELRGIGAALAAFGKVYGKQTGSRGRLSAAARSRIAAAQRARWAKVRENKAEQAKVVPIRGRRTLSAAARKRIAAAQRARWARVKAGKKTA